MGLHYTGLLPLLGGLLVMVSAYQGLRGDLDRGSKLLRLGCLVLLIGWIVYEIPFLALDYTLVEAYWSTSPGLPLWMRLASAWAGGGGSLYLFTVIAAASVLALVGLRGRIERSTLLVFSGVLLAGLATAFLNGAFNAMEHPPASGAGLNPLLKSPWLYPHPLTTFGGYALLLVSSLAMLLGLRESRCLPLFEAGWALLTLGILLGGYWSYETFGWGGYWAWDPVETSELMVWLVATAWLHARTVVRSVSRPLLALTASSVFLAMYVTRTGLSPLHSFASPGIASYILLVSALVPMGYSAYTSTLALEDSLAEARRGLRRGPETAGLVIASAALTASALFVYMTLLAPSILSALGAEVGVPQMARGVAYYHPVLYPLLLVILASTPMAFQGSRLGWRGSLAVLASLAVVSLVLGLAAGLGRLVLAPLSPATTNAMMAAGLPWACTALISSLAYMVVTLRRRRVERALVGLVHLGLALTVVGFLLSGTYAFNEAYLKTFSLKPGEPVRVGDLEIVLEGYKYGIGGGLVDIYTGYAGKSTVYHYAWHGLRALGEGLGELMRLAEAGERLVAGNKTLLRLVELALGEPAKAESLTAELTGKVMVAGMVVNESIAYAGPITMTLTNASLEVVLAPQTSSTGSLTGTMVRARLTVGKLVLEAPSLPIHGYMPERRYLVLELTEPARLRFGDVVVEARRLVIASQRLFGGTGNVTVSPGRIVFGNAVVIPEGRLVIGSGSVKVPSTLPPEVFAYMAVKGGEQRFLKAVRSSELYTVISSREKLEKLLRPPECRGMSARECVGYLDAPKLVPETAWLDIKVRVKAGGVEAEETARIRFEAYGEIQGIHGLVAKVIHLSLGLNDVYIVLSPPTIEPSFDPQGTPVHELLVYYLSQVFKKLPPEKRVALAALMATGYTLDMARSLPAEQRPSFLARAIADLYILAERFNPANSTIAVKGLTVQVKVIPFVGLVWLGPVTMTVAGLGLSLAHTARPRGGSSGRERS